MYIGTQVGRNKSTKNGTKIEPTATVPTPLTIVATPIIICYL